MPMLTGIYLRVPVRGSCQSVMSEEIDSQEMSYGDKTSNCMDVPEICVEMADDAQNRG